MATKQRQGRAAPEEKPPDPQPPDPVLVKFSQELGQRFPERMIKRFTMPSNVRECREVFILEITSRDEIQAAIMADSMMSAIEKGSYKLTQEAERREAIRLAIVGIGRQVGDRVAYEHANDTGIPLAEINDWSIKAWTALHLYFGQLNGLADVEIAEGLVGAQTVGAFAPPISATPASAEHGR